MNKNARIAAIQREAENAFSNYAGPSRDQLIGVNDQSFFSNMGGSPLVAVENSIKTIIFNIENTDEVNDLAVPLFSANEEIAIPFNGVKDTITGNTAALGKGIIVKPKGYSIKEIRDMLRVNPFTIAGLRYSYGDNVQYKQEWVARYKKATAITTEEITLFKNLSDSIDGELEDPNFVQLVDGGTTIFLTIAKAPSATVSRVVKVAFKIGASFDNTNPLLGKSAIIKHGPQFSPNQNVRLL